MGASGRAQRVCIMAGAGAASAAALTHLRAGTSEQQRSRAHWWRGAINRHQKAGMRSPKFLIGAACLSGADKGRAQSAGIMAGAGAALAAALTHAASRDIGTAALACPPMAGPPNNRHQKAAKTDSKCYPTREMALSHLFALSTSEPLGAYAPPGNDVIIIRRCSALGIMIVSSS